MARVEIEMQHASGGSSASCASLSKGDNLFDHVRRAGPVQRASSSPTSTPSTTPLSFTNGVVLQAGEATGDVNEARIAAHPDPRGDQGPLRKGADSSLHQGIKVLSLFFIDEVVKYRDYSEADEKGEYAASSKRNTASCSRRDR